MKIVSNIDDASDDDPSSATPLSDLLEDCGPWRVLEPWAALRPVPAVSGLVDPVRTLERLRKRHADEDLVESHVIVSGPGGEPVLNPQLVGAEKCLVPLSGGPDERPSDILTADGCLSGRLPVIAALRERQAMKGRNRAAERVVVAFSIADVVALRTLGLESVLATGLERLAGEPLTQIAAACGWDAPRRTGVKLHSGKPATLTFANWAPATLSGTAPAAALTAVRHHFRGVEMYLRYEIAHTEVWTPSESDLRGISFCLRYGDRDSVRQTVQASLHSSSVLPLPLGHDERDAKPKPLSVSAAIKELYRCAAEHPESLSDAWSQAMAALDREVITPLVDQALKCSDASEKAHRLARAHLYRTIHSRILLDATKFKVAIRESGLRRCAPRPLEELQQLARLLESQSPDAGSMPASAARGPGRRRMRY